MVRPKVQRRIVKEPEHNCLKHGKIEIEESVGRFAIGGGMAVRTFDGELKIETMELVIRGYSDTVGRSSMGAFCRPVEMEESRL